MNEVYYYETTNFLSPTFEYILGSFAFGGLAIDRVGHRLVRFPDPPYGVGREKEPPRSWEKNFEAT